MVGGGTVPRVALLPPPSCSLLQRHLAGWEQPHGACNGPFIATSGSGCKATKSEFHVFKFFFDDHGAGCIFSTAIQMVLSHKRLLWMQ